jgi:hypothetical protein
MKNVQSDGCTPGNSADFSPSCGEEFDASTSPVFISDSKSETDQREAIEWHTFQRIVDHLSSGLRLEEVLDLVFQEMRDLVPFDRIGFLAIDSARKCVRLKWSQSCVATTPTPPDYAMELSQFGLDEILRSREPCIIGELSTHLQNNPGAEPSQMLLLDGMRSSLTCPVVAGEKPVGFLFFSSLDPEIYSSMHSRIYCQIARHLGFMIEKARLVDELMEMNQLRSRLLGIVAHDLRTPLNVINGYIQLFANGVVDKTPEQVLPIWNTMQHSCDRMLMMVNQLVDLSAIEAGHLVLERTWTDVSLFMGQVHREMSILGKTKGVQLVWSIDTVEKCKKEPVLFYMDDRRMFQVLENLLSNAFKFSSPGSTVDVTFRLYAGGAGEFTVRDTGKGILPEDQQILFSDFGCGQIKPAVRESSSGLGLAICKRIVEAHGGRIWLVSAPGDGTIIHVMLPGAEKQDGTQNEIKI